MMRHLFLNEISIYPLAKSFDEAWRRVNQLILTYKARPEHLFKSRIRSDVYLGDVQLTEDLTLQAFCKESRGRTLGTLLLGLTQHPYIEDDSTQVEDYLQATFTILKDGQVVEVTGLAAAHLHDSIAIGFESDEYWKGVVFDLTVKTTDSENIFPVLCVSASDHFNTTQFKEWRDMRTEIELIESNIAYESKKIHLRDDHGYDKLHAFAKRLIASPYVCEVINSLPFNPSARNFVKEAKNDGLIELVLTSTDAGYGLVVRTTGRNQRETERIASILQEQFGQ